VYFREVGGSNPLAPTHYSILVHHRAFLVVGQFALNRSFSRISLNLADFFCHFLSLLRGCFSSWPRAWAGWLLDALARSITRFPPAFPGRDPPPVGGAAGFDRIVFTGCWWIYQRLPGYRKRPKRQGYKNFWRYIFPSP